jgi:hypothetical protein
VARIGPEAVATEYDNDPPEEAGPVESAITPHRIQKSVSGLNRKVVPRGCTLLTPGIDVRKLGLHWVVRAWSANGLNWSTIDYDFFEIFGTTRGIDDGVELATHRGILNRIDQTRTTEYRNEDGDLLPVARSLVDAGCLTDVVYSDCMQTGRT